MNPDNKKFPFCVQESIIIREIHIRNIIKVLPVVFSSDFKGTSLKDMNNKL